MNSPNELVRVGRRVAVSPRPDAERDQTGCVKGVQGRMGAALRVTEWTNSPIVRIQPFSLARFARRRPM
jgi:hypothetical protein